MKKIVLSLTAILSASFLFSQEALKSTEEEYYDFLSLQGIVERPTLGYRTLSDSEWKFIEKEEDVVDEDGNPLTDEAGNKLTNLVMPDHPWQKNNLGTKRTLWQGQEGKNWFTRGFDHSLKLKIYGPEWYNSFNTAAPYGQNDGALWQGKGYNSSLTGGARLEAYGFEVTLKPQVSFSQNLSFDYIQPNYSGENYADKAAKYGYYGVASIDAPQRFGDSAFWNYDWGDTEIRWTWYNFTTGFGTQAIWLGPAKLNPIIHSNNAPSYPKFDIGLRKTAIYMPHFGWHLGTIEARAWWGRLSESKYFDNNSSNDHNLISGLSINYQFPGIFKGFSVGFNRIMLSKWNDMNAYSLFRIYVPEMNGNSDSADQRFSMTFDYIFPKIGFELYLEWARNDFSPNMDYVIRYPYHTQAWTFGAEKTFNFTSKYGLKLLLELTYLENSADYDRLINWYTTFYCHGEISQGHTNRGQWLGAGIGTGGNCQYLGAEFFYPRGAISIFGQRRNPDLDYTMYIDAKNDAENIKKGIFNAEGNIRCNLDFGVSSVFFFTENLMGTAKFVFEDERNPLNKSASYGKSAHRYNCSISLGAKYNF